MRDDCELEGGSKGGIALGAVRRVKWWRFEVGAEMGRPSGDLGPRVDFTN